MTLTPFKAARVVKFLRKVTTSGRVARVIAYLRSLVYADPAKRLDRELAKAGLPRPKGVKRWDHRSSAFVAAKRRQDVVTNMLRGAV